MRKLMVVPVATALLLCACTSHSAVPENESPVTNDVPTTQALTATVGALCNTVGSGATTADGTVVMCKADGSLERARWWPQERTTNTP